MEPKKYNVLLIDDHPLISEAYKSAFNHISKNDETYSFSIDMAHDCDTAIQKIKEYTKSDERLEVVFLDISLPPSQDGKILSGEDLGLKLNELLPDTKIIISTTFNDNYRIHSIFRNINPDGFLIKNDITSQELVTAILNVLTDPPYYSKTVMKLLRKQVSSEFLLDNIDRKILFELSIGTRMKDLSEIVHLSIPGIEKRKRHLKQIFDIQEDRDLILVAKEKGFI